MPMKYFKQQQKNKNNWISQTFVKNRIKLLSQGGYEWSKET